MKICPIVLFQIQRFNEFYPPFNLKLLISKTLLFYPGREKTIAVDLIYNPFFFPLRWRCQHQAGISRDKTMHDKLMYIVHHPCHVYKNLGTRNIYLFSNVPTFSDKRQNITHSICQKIHLFSIVCSLYYLAYLNKFYI